MGPAKSSSAIMLSHFKSPATALYAAERFMRFPQYGSLTTDVDSEFPLYRSTCDSFSISSGDPSDQSCEQDKLTVDHGAFSWRRISVPKETHDREVIIVPLVCYSNCFLFDDLKDTD